MDLLYAQARVYDRVKNWNRLNFLFSIIVPLLLSFVTVYNRSREFVDSELLSSLLGLYGLLVLTFNIVISGHISALRRKAASIQEMYDCRVLGIWICPYISRHLLSLTPLQARCRRYSRGER
ncbi:S-4TM family putative pore-forming effector (plasmid) [Shigella dysenteriae]|nr:S-4TM family putative pore-forming effector [Escherichia coli]